MNILELCGCEHPEACAVPKPPRVCRRLAGISAKDCEHDWGDDAPNDNTACLKCGMPHLDYVCKKLHSGFRTE